MSVRTGILVAFVALCAPAMGFSANSSAYVLLSGTNGSITPVSPESGTLGASYFVPAGGTQLAVPRGSKEVWELFNTGDSVAVLDSASGATLATIQLAMIGTTLSVDPAGQYVYVFGSNVYGTTYYLDKISVASRQVVLQVTVASPVSQSYEVGLSSDGSQLFACAYGEVAVFDTQTLATGPSIPVGCGSVLVYGNTLLVADNTELFYFDTSTLQQTNSATIIPGTLFAVNPAGTKIFLWNAGVTVLDFSSGEMLVTQPIKENISEMVLSPDGSQVLVAGEVVLVMDANTLATNERIVSIASVVAAVYLDSTTALLLNAAETPSAMAVIDQATASVVTTFPVGAEVGAAFADPSLGAVWVGGYEGPLNLVSAAANRVVKSYWNNPDQFWPAARVGGSLYGYASSAGAYCDLSTGLFAGLPEPITVGQNYFEQVYGGLALPDGGTYWAPFSISFTGGCCSNPLPSSGIAIYSTTTKALVSRFAPPGGAGPFVFAPNGDTAYIAGINIAGPAPSVIAVFDTHTLQNTATFNYATAFSALAISADGATLYATDGVSVYVLNPTTGAQEQVFPLPLPGATAQMALSLDGKTLFVTVDSTQMVYLMDTTSGEVKQVDVVGSPSAIAVLPSS